MTATHLKNLIPTSECGEKTPLERWTGRKPTICYLKTFGCLAFYYVPKIERSKLNPVARRGIFVGYSQDSKGYRIYDHVKRKTVIARTVKLYEKIKGSRLLRENDKIQKHSTKYC